MYKDFDSWNEEKKRTETRSLVYDFFYYSREVWWCSVGINVGVESDGKERNFARPVLVVRKFNKDMFWGVPLTTNEKVGDFYEKVEHIGGPSWAILSQMKTFSSKRLLRKIDVLSENKFEIIRSKLKRLL